MVCYKGNGVSTVYINGRVCTLPLPVRNSRKKVILIENLLESYLQESNLFLYWNVHELYRYYIVFVSLTVPR